MIDYLFHDGALRARPLPLPVVTDHTPIARVGAAVLMNELYESIEEVADWCEDACDQIRVIIIRGNMLNEVKIDAKRSD
jgi:hypothetical protein